MACSGMLFCLKSDHFCPFCLFKTPAHKGDPKGTVSAVFRDQLYMLSHPLQIWLVLVEFRDFVCVCRCESVHVCHNVNVETGHQA